jgi:hypothetical protein
MKNPNDFFKQAYGKQPILTVVATGIVGTVLVASLFPGTYASVTGAIARAVGTLKSTLRIAA